MLRARQTYFDLRGRENFDPHKIELITWSFLKFSQVKDMAYTILVP